MDEKLKSLKSTARTAGLWYLVMAITGGFGLVYTPSQIIVRGDAMATASNILSHEFLFRSGILSNLICQTSFVFLALALYRLFRQVNERLAKGLVALVLVAVPIAFLIIFNQLFALLILKENFVTALGAVERNTMAMMFLRMFDYGNTTIGIFWGLWLIPFGLLVYKSQFIPKVFGILLVAGGIAYVLDATTFVLLPHLQRWSNILVSIFSSVSELGMVLWLLIVGARKPT